MRNKSNASFFQSRQKRTFLISMIIVLLFFTLGCFHIESSHREVIKDAESHEPLIDTVVLLELDYTRFLPPNPAGPNSVDLGIEETLTDNNGSYKLPLKVYFLPPLLCFTDKLFTYFKPGYFPSVADEADDVELYKINHYLNFLPYKNPDRYLLSSDLKEGSKYFRAALDKTKKMELIQVEDKGIFLKVIGKKFLQIFTKRDRDEVHKKPDHVIFYVYDQSSQDWLSFDSRGQLLEVKASNIPRWEFMDSAITWGWPIYANNNSIFYPIEENPIPAGLKYEKDGIQYITPNKGKISALAGTANTFFTIEDNESSLCHYGYSTIPHFLKCFTGEDLPDSEEDDTLNHSQFKHIVQTLNHGFFVVTKTPKYWHIYNLYGIYGAGDKNEKARIFKELIAFPIEKEITAFTTVGNELFIAFKNEGIRRYDIILSFGLKVKEYPSFLINSKAAKYSDIYSMVITWAINMQAIYATTGEDKIYRFSLEGIPDFQVKMK